MDMKSILSVAVIVVLGLISQKTQAQTTNNAYGDNQIIVDHIAGVPVFAIYSGDINQDGSVDIYDFPLYDADNLAFGSGYLPTDLNGDGSVDIFDFPIYDANNLAFVGIVRP